METPNASLPIVLSLLVCCSLPAFAVGEFESGCRFYKLKDYKQARPCFETAVKDFPTNWTVHYYLANTYLALGRSMNARREYEACLKFHPSAATAKYCQDVIVKLGGSLPDLNPEASNGSGGTTSGIKSADSQTDDSSSPTIAHERARAAETMKKAEAECAKIRAETKELLTNGSKLSNDRWIRPDGSPYIDWTDDQREAITRDSDERCKRIMDQAIRSTAHVKN